jgi:hypothetical protein
MKKVRINPPDVQGESMSKKKKKKMPDKLQIWIDARKRYRLSHAQVQMARELGLNPGKFGGVGNNKHEPWKEPLPQFIEHLYFKRFGKTAPDRVLSIEEQLSEEQRKRQERNARNQAKTSAASTQSSGEQSGDADQSAAPGDQVPAD